MTVRELEGYVANFRLRTKQLSTAKMPMRPGLALEILENACEDIPELAALFEERNVRDATSTDELLDRLDTLVMQRLAQLDREARRHRALITRKFRRVHTDARLEEQ